ncbi:MAG TPA: hypothetical protein VFE13_04580 [Caulobacteraceae bacterium]|nr:hypothetical protein [Caulobacteraceae bacterium]
MNRNAHRLCAAALTLIGGSALAASAATATPVSSGTPPQVINIGGSIDLLCGGAGLTSTTLNLTSDLADTNGFVNDTAYVGKSAVTGNLWCNGVNSTATVTHVNLTNTTTTGTPPDGFTRVVTFVPKVTFTPAVGANTVINGDAANTVIGLFNGTATISLQSGGPANASLRPLAGAYAGSVSFTVTPAS